MHPKQVALIVAEGASILAGIFLGFILADGFSKVTRLWNEKYPGQSLLDVEMGTPPEPDGD